MPEKKHVVAGIIRRDDDSILIACRRDGVNKGKWEFPGGKVEKGESHETALAREITEEFNSAVEPGEYVCEVPLEVNDISYVMYAYNARALSGEFTPADPEYSTSRWVSVAQLEDAELAPADTLIAKALIHTERDRICENRYS